MEQEIRLRRTERSTVPPGAHQQAENLFTKQVKTSWQCGHLLAVPIVTMYVCMYTCTWHRALCTNQVLSPALIYKDGMGLGWCWSMCSVGYLMVLTRHCSPSLLPPLSLPPLLPPFPFPHLVPVPVQLALAQAQVQLCPLHCGGHHTPQVSVFGAVFNLPSQLRTGPHILFTDCV